MLVGLRRILGWVDIRENRRSRREPQQHRPYRQHGLERVLKLGVQAGQRAVHEVGSVLLPEMASG